MDGGGLAVVPADDESRSKSFFSASAGGLCCAQHSSVTRLVGGYVEEKPEGH